MRAAEEAIDKLDRQLPHQLIFAVTRETANGGRARKGLKASCFRAPRGTQTSSTCEEAAGERDRCGYFVSKVCSPSPGMFSGQSGG